MADPEIWGAIHRLAVVMEKLDTRDTVRMDGPWEDLKDAATGQGCPGNWAGVQKPMTTNTTTVPNEISTIDGKKAMIKYFEGKIKQNQEDIEIIKKDYRDQMKQAKESVKNPRS